MSCSQESEPITFSEQNLIQNEYANIEINYPKAMGNKSVSSLINNSIETTIATEISLSDEITYDDLNDAVEAFDKEYRLFKNKFQETGQIWEALVDSEVLYESDEIISISISTYIDTGGAHGNTHIIFLNYDPETGDEISREELLNDGEEFRDLAIKYFKKHLENKKHDLDVVDSFYGKDFQLPETIGLTDGGVIILYNTYEIASYSFGITEFVIPFEESSKYLNRH